MLKDATKRERAKVSFKRAKTDFGKTKDNSRRMWTTKRLEKTEKFEKQQLIEKEE